MGENKCPLNNQLRGLRKNTGTQKGQEAEQNGAVFWDLTRGQVGADGVRRGGKEQITEEQRSGLSTKAQKQKG